jgi:hypothetical protein
MRLGELQRLFPPRYGLHSLGISKQLAVVADEIADRLPGLETKDVVRANRVLVPKGGA